MGYKKPGAIAGNQRDPGESLAAHPGKRSEKKIFTSVILMAMPNIAIASFLWVQISKVVQLLKGESSFWINKQNFCEGTFEWQPEYFAVSVSETMVDKVRRYITNQERHHQSKSFQQEYDELISKYGFQKFG